jgi:asparagine synthase (glutamine-hydrolysing)
VCVASANNEKTIYMCGIYGQFHRCDPRGADRALVERMAGVLAHRGPDGYGLYDDGGIVLGAGRLAIIDLAAAAGPLFNEDRQIAVVFNGEIYNYKALRLALEQAGHCFTTHTDTEVIVHGYEQWGTDVISKLHGMFALGVWDAARRRLVLARDRLGEKPLYYAEVGSEFLFASEAKALLEAPQLPRQVNPDALPIYLTLGYTPPPHTMFKGVSKLAPGEMLIVDQATVQAVRYWQPTLDGHNPDRLSYADAVQRVRHAVFEAVESRMMSDVPLGAFLSGGVDSTAVVAIMSRLVSRPITTFTVGFNDPRDKFNVDDHFAALAAERLKTDHHRITIQQDERLAALLPHLIYALDEPVAQPAIIQTAYVAALARQHGVPVLLSGDASDELFAGYPAYRADQTLQRYLQLPALLRNAVLTPLLERLPARFDALRKLAHKSRTTDPVERYLLWMRLIALEQQPALFAPTQHAVAQCAPANVGAVLRPLLGAPHTPHFADRIAFASLNLWVAEDSNMRVDKMSMAMSVETRAPFEDHRLVALAYRLPLAYKLRGGGFKTVLKDALRDLLPTEILKRPKWGFFPPISDWLRTVFKPLVERYLSPQHVAAVGWFEPRTVSRLVQAHLSKQSYELWPLWTLLVFHLWHALYIDGSLVLPHKIASQHLMLDTMPAHAIK